MATISIILKKSKTNSKGEHPVTLRLSDSNNKRAYFSTGFTCKENHFDSSCGRFCQGRGVTSFKVLRKEDGGGVKEYSNREANDKLAELERRARGIIKKYNEDHVNWGFDQFRADFTNAPSRNHFLAFSLATIESEYRQQDRFKRAQIAKEALNSLNSYDDDLPKKVFQDITPAYIQGYIKYCRDRGNTNNTIGMRLRELRCFYNIAIREKVVSSDLYPFSSGREDGKVRIPKIEQNKTDQYLPLESMKKLAAATFDDPILDRTRHLYLFSYHCRGINWKDMALITNANFYKATVTDVSTKKSRQVTMMQYTRSKTKGEFDIQVTDGIQKELDWFKLNTVLLGDYLLPIIGVHQEPEKLDGYLHQVRMRFNKSLKDIAKTLKLPESQQNITFYSARHSFAMTMQDKGKSVEIISQALGHQSVETTKHYLAKFSTTRMAEETTIDLSMDEEKPKKTRKKAATEKPKKSNKKTSAKKSKKARAKK